MAFVPVPHPRSNARPGSLLAMNSINSGGEIPVSQGGLPKEEKKKNRYRKRDLI
jgi:hypothetical protein